MSGVRCQKLESRFRRERIKTNILRRINPAKAGLRENDPTYGLGQLVIAVGRMVSASAEFIRR